MRRSLIIAALVLFSSIAHADLANDFYKQNCETADVKALIGKKGSCRVVVAPKKIEKQGYCVGTLFNAFTCSVSFVSIKNIGMMNLRCLKVNSEVVIDQDMNAEAVGYTVATLINTREDKDIVRNDNNKYIMFSNSLIDLTLIENAASGTLTGSVFITLQGRAVPLDNLTCKY